MRGLLFLLLCTTVLGAAGVEISDDPNEHGTTRNYGSNEATSVMSTQSPTSVSRLPNNPSTSPSPLPSRSSSPSPSSSSSPSSSTSPSPSPESTLKEWFNIMINKRECRPVLLVTGGLMVVCTLLLVSTLLLACKVCRQSRRIKALSCNEDLISDCEYRMGTVEKSKGSSEAEPKETNVLLAQEEASNGTTKEEGGKATEGEPMEQEDKTEEGDAAKGEEASTTPGAVTEDSPSTKPQEEAADPPPTDGVETSTSEGTEEPKEVV